MFDSLRARFAAKPSADKDPAMPSKFIYLSDEHHGDTDALTILSPKQLDELLENEAWDVIKRTKRTVKDATGRKVQVEYLELAKRSAERGLARVPRENDDARPPREDRGLATMDTPSRGLMNPAGDNGSYLGSGSAFAHLIGSTPGVAVANNMAGDVAYGMGVDAAKLGFGMDRCPEQLSPGSLPHEQWMKGWRAGGGVGEEAPVASMREAYAAGKRAAKLPEDAEVSCAYPPGTALYAEFTRGFSENGGTVV